FAVVRGDEASKERYGASELINQRQKLPRTSVSAAEPPLALRKPAHCHPERAKRAEGAKLRWFAVALVQNEPCSCDGL
ncbi:MAG: hypothetical protein ACLSVD_14700, partial [Eggerthellaceae bacterium]